MDIDGNLKRFAAGKKSLYNSHTCRTIQPRRLLGAWPRHTGGWCCLQLQQKCLPHLKTEKILLLSLIILKMNETGHNSFVSFTLDYKSTGNNVYFLQKALQSYFRFPNFSLIILHPSSNIYH